MFYGEYAHMLDAKGRMSMPARYREELGEKFMVTKGINNCLFVFPMGEWNAFADKLRALPTTDKTAQIFLRFLFAGACECELDKQGRILLPASLREFAGLEKEVMVIGAMTRAEIWNRDRWKEYSNAAADEYDEVLAQMAQLGI